MALKPQSIRKGMTILLDGQTIEKQELIKLSESWSEPQINFFKKMLKQGGDFKINGQPFRTIPANKILDSTGKKDGGIVQIPGLDTRF
jgi:hypothetical protein